MRQRCLSLSEKAKARHRHFLCVNIHAVISVERLTAEHYQLTDDQLTNDIMRAVIYLGREGRRFDSTPTSSSKKNASPPNLSDMEGSMIVHIK